MFDDLASTVFKKAFIPMQLTRQIKIWLIIALVHASVIYALSRAGAVEIVRTIVTASVVSSELPTFTEGVQTPRSKDTAVDSPTTVAQKTMVGTSPQNHLQNNAAEPVRDDGVRSVQPNPTTAATKTLALTQSFSNSSNNPTNGTTSATSNIYTPPATAATHIGGYLHNPQPRYSMLSQAAHERGKVTLRVMVEADGHPSSVDVIKSSGYDRLDRSARDTVLKQYRFIPATHGGQPIRAFYNFSINF